MDANESISTRTEQDARLLEAIQRGRDLGWLGSDRGLAEDVGLAPTVFYKVRNGLQSFPKEGLFALEKLIGLNPAFVREGIKPPYVLPQRPGGEKMSVFERVRIASLAADRAADEVQTDMALPATKWKLLKTGSEAKIAGLTQALARAFPQISTAWLLMGIGTPQPVATTSVAMVPAPQIPASQAPLVLHLPFIDIRARASFVSSYLSGTTPDQLPLQPYLSKADLRPPANALLIEVEGDSMVPTLHPRDVLLIAPIAMSEWKYISGGIYMVVYGYDHLVVKRIHRNTLSTEGILRLESDNPTGGSLDLPAEVVQGIFKVLAVTRNL